MRLLSMLFGVVAVVACKATDNLPIGGGLVPIDAALPIDAPPDAACTNVTCDVRVDCAGVISPVTVPLCMVGKNAGPFEAAANAAAMDQVVCTQGATFTATCTAAKSAFTCADGFELEDATVCLPGKTYDADTSDVCAHLPANQGACSVACDRTALYAFAPTVFEVFFCTSTDGITYQVGAAPMTGDGSR